MTKRVHDNVLLELPEISPPLQVTALRQGIGNMFFINFAREGQIATGTAVDTRTGPELWIHMCRWELRKSDKVLTESSSRNPLFFEKLHDLVGLNLTGIHRTKDNSVVIFSFEGGYNLLISEATDQYDDNAMFIIFEDGKYKRSFEYPEGIVFHPGP